MLEHLIQSDWRNLLAPTMATKDFQSLERHLVAEVASHEICPSMDDLFHAFNACPYKKTRVVILGQDPYITPGQSDGLAFSVRKGVRIPPTLLNIFKALKKDLGCYIPDNGCLEPWAEQGVLLLNSILTVRAHKSRSHAGIGWEQFTEEVIKLLNKHDRSLVFILWGNQAKRALKFIDRQTHLILTGNHPSPIIACNTFVDCKHFSKANEYLYETSPTTIDWQIPNIGGIS